MKAGNRVFSKNSLPNIVAALLVVVGWFLGDTFGHIVLTVGLFSLSGALTNWLAVHMLFERVPGLYGSGVIPTHFEAFKKSLHQLATQELFKAENVERAMQSATDADHTSLDLTKALDALDLNIAFDRMVEIIMESSFGSMLGMLGGKEALDPMKEPFKEKIHDFLVETASSESFQQAIHQQISQVTTSDDFLQKVDQIIHERLEELTPDMVKEMIQRMIKEHLGWLVVWGAVFGGLIGLITALLSL